MRGDIIDIFSVNYDDPIRIELFGDEIESIRTFDIASQTSKEQIKEIDILPANDFLLTDEERKEAGEKIHFRLEQDQEIIGDSMFSNLRNLTDTDIMDILEYNYSSRIYRYFSLIAKSVNTIVDYCKKYTTVLVDESGLMESNKLLWEESHSYLSELFENGHILFCELMSFF